MFCDCEKDGHCHRYNKPMYGRMRELCQGINVDPGTAEAFRQQWRREAGMPEPQESLKPRPLLLQTHQSPGDALVMTAAIYSLHRCHPGKYYTSVESPHLAIFENNPDVLPIEQARAMGAEPLRMHYPAINDCNTRGIHFMQGYTEFLGASLGIPLPLMTNRPMLYLSQAEKATKPANLPAKYWLISAGCKRDFTNKFWGTTKFQEVTNQLRGTICFVQVGAKGDDHQPLEGVVNLVGQTSLRQLIQLAYHAQGVLSGVTFLQHVAAAFNKPAVVIMGGREPVQWNAYPKQHLLHTIGMLPCCENGGCWKSRTVKLNDGSHEDNSLCEKPTANGLPLCMTMISPKEVSEKILQYSA